MIVALPRPSEQAQIAHFLDQTTATINAIIAGSQRQINLLREYRTRLIADVVTGKVDVREAAASLCSEGALGDEDGLDEVGRPVGENL